MAVFLAPIMHIGFIDDEDLNSYIDGWIGWHHTTWWSFYSMVVHLWIATYGRFMPLNLGSVYLLFHLTHSAPVVKTVQIILILLNVVTFGVVCARIARSSAFGTLCMVCVAFTLQIRASGYDPVAAFAPLMPVVTEFMLLALLCQLIYHRGRHPIALFCAVAAYVAAALTYEIVYAYLIIIVLLAWTNRSTIKSFIIESIVFTVPIVALVGVNIVLRSAAHMTADNPYSLSLTLGPYFRTFFVQLAAALPLLSLFTLPTPNVGPIAALFIAKPLLPIGIGAVLAAVALVAIRRIMRDADVPENGFTLLLPAAIGLLLWILAVPAMAASPRWQATLFLGQGYLPVYFEYFGLALVVAVVIMLICRAVRLRAVVVTIAILVGVCTFLTYQWNQPALSAYQPIWTQGRFSLEESARSGVFASIPAGSRIVLDHSYVWDYDMHEPDSNTRYLLYQLLGVRYEVVDPLSQLDRFCGTGKRHAGPCTPDSPLYAYSSDNVSLIPGDRWVRTSRIEFIAPDINGIQQPYAQSATIFARGAPLVRLGSQDAGTRVEVVSRKERGVVASVRSCLAEPAEMFPGDVPIELSSTFYGTEYAATETFHWSQHKSAMLISAGDQSVDVSLTFRVSTFVPGTSVSIVFGGHKVLVKATPLGVPVSLRLHLAPEARERIDFELIGRPFSTPTDPRELAFRLLNIHASSKCASI